MEELEECLRQAEEERAKKTATFLGTNLQSNPNAQQIQQKLACFERKADKWQCKTLINLSEQVQKQRLR